MPQKEFWVPQELFSEQLLKHLIFSKCEENCIYSILCNGKVLVCTTSSLVVDISSAHHCSTHHFAHPVKHGVYDLFANGIVTTSIIIGCILLATDELLRVVQLTIVSVTDLICISNKRDKNIKLHSM